jgi:hypothetical protein
MNITHFDHLLTDARQQSQPQRLLLVFASASLPSNATAEQRARFDAGESGELAPSMCVDKNPSDLADFAALAQEARTLSADWALVFAAALSGAAGRPPSSQQIDNALQRMVDSVKSGHLLGMIPFDRQGEAVALG